MPAMQFADACVVGGGVAVLAVYIGTFTFSECITQLLTSRTVYKVSARRCNLGLSSSSLTQ